MHTEPFQQQISSMISKSQAHLDAAAVLRGIPSESRGFVLDGVPYSPWQLLEHLRIVQQDILEFSRDPEHISPQYPEACWPETIAPPTEAAWEESVRLFLRDLQSVTQLMADPALDLLSRIPHGSGQTYLREAVLLIDHNAYHLGQFVLLGRLLLKSRAA